MGALQALSWERLPPAGEPVLLADGAADGDFPRACFAPYRHRFFGSGTSALAAAVRAAVHRAGRAQAEVLLPAYACPNVVSAVWYAGARPRLVDLEPDRPWMQAQAIGESTRPSTVAIIAVDLFGVPERYATLVPMARDSELILIEDSAQAFPRRNERFWQGDLVVVSFGRGKPVSLLGGGAVLYRDPAFASLLPRVTRESNGAAIGVGFSAQTRLYNALRRPALYWLPAGLPLLRLGETRFKPLTHLEGGQPDRLRHLQVNIEDYWRRDDASQRAVAGLVASLDQDLVVDLPQACGAGEPPRRLLRYPLLIKDSALRDAVYNALHRAGLGASTLYNAALPGIRGLARLADRPYPCAERFARQLLTLAVHSGVTPAHVERMHALFVRFGLVR